jgi:hypothetical protein
MPVSWLVIVTCVFGIAKLAGSRTVPKLCLIPAIVIVVLCLYQSTILSREYQETAESRSRGSADLHRQTSPPHPLQKNVVSNPRHLVWSQNPITFILIAKQKESEGEWIL